MALDFPASPNAGQIFQSGGITWVWDGTKWAAAGVAGAPVVYVGDTPPPNPGQGTMWFDSVSGQTFIYYTDPTSSQWVPSNAPMSPPVSSGQGNVGRNLVHNPLFRVQQRGAGPWTVMTNAYTVDRWCISGGSGDTVSVTAPALADVDRAAIGDEAASYYLRVAFTGTSSTNSWTSIQQPIEFIRRLSGKTIIVSFWAIASVAGLKLGINLYAAMGSGGSPSTSDWVQPTGAVVTLTTSWVRYSVTITFPSLAGKTLGTNGDDRTILVFAYSSGSANNAGSGNIGVQSGVISMWGIQAEIAQPGQTQPTPLEKIDPGEDLRRCQRFYCVVNIVDDYTALSPGVSGLYRQYKTPVTMRATPSMTYANITYYSNGADTPITPYSGNVNPDAVGIRCIGLTNGQGISGGIIMASADL